MDTKHNADEVNDRVPGISAISGIKTEPSGDDTDKCDVDSKEPIKMSELESPTTSGNVEQVFIKKEDDPDAGGTASISIKSEPPGDEWDKYIAEDKSIVEMETENYKLDMEMSGKVKPELLIKKEWDNDPAAVYEVSASRIKKDADELEAGPAGGVKEEADMEDDEDYQLTEDCDIKSESGASMDAASDVPSNSVERSIISKKQDEVVYGPVGTRSFSCYTCNYTTSSKDRLIDHMIVHDNKKYVPRYTKRDHGSASASVSNKKDMLWTCSHCDAKYKARKTLEDHVVRKHPNFISSVTSKVYKCSECLYKTIRKCRLDEHMSVHFKIELKRICCMHCNRKFTRKARLDDHILRAHPDFISSVTTKLHECTKCSFKAIRKDCLDRHLLKHPEVALDFKHSICIHCKAIFIDKTCLDDHVVRKHPDFITSVTSKLFECTKCTFKTVKKLTFDNHVVRNHPDIVSSVTSKLYECTKCTFKTVIHGYFYKHLLEHSEVPSDFKRISCVHCKATFKRKLALDNHMVKKHRAVASDSELRTCIHCNATYKEKRNLDDHVVRKHPEFVTSVTSKLHECTKCAFKTVKKLLLDNHVLRKHPDFITTVTSKSTLDDHLARKHPDFISSVTSKIHECRKCAFKAVEKRDLNRHLQTHSEIALDSKLITCIHCNATYKEKRDLDNHVVRKHPEFVTSVTSKLHECTKCAFKTVKKLLLVNHVLRKHPEYNDSC